MGIFYFQVSTNKNIAFFYQNKERKLQFRQKIQVFYDYSKMICRLLFRTSNKPSAHGRFCFFYFSIFLKLPQGVIFGQENFFEKGHFPKIPPGVIFGKLRYKIQNPTFQFRPTYVSIAIGVHMSKFLQQMNKNCVKAKLKS